MASQSREDIGATHIRREPYLLTRGSLEDLARWLWRCRGGILWIVDFAFIWLAFMACYSLRFELGLLPLFSGTDPPPLAEYTRGGVLLALFWTVSNWRARRYDSRFHQLQNLASEIRSVIYGGFTALCALMIVSFMYRPLLLSRVVYFSGSCLAAIFLLMIRCSASLIKAKLIAQGVAFSRTFVISGPENHAAIPDLISRLGIHANELVGIAVCKIETPHRCKVAANSRDFSLEGEIGDVHAALGFDRLLILNENFFFPNDAELDAALIPLLNFCEERGIAMYIMPAKTDILISRGDMGSHFGVPIFLLKDSANHPVYAVVKRGMDVAISLLVLTLGLPLWIALAIAIKLSSPGAILYVQKRTGTNGHPFEMYKFRSMVANADQKLGELVDFKNLQEPVFNIRDDPRVTRVGRFLRRTSLDEIPQLINVLAGSMSIIGPRPERIELTAKYNPWQWRRLKAKPGITGFQQVMSRGDPSLARRIEYDLYYLKYQGPWLDFVILVKTVLVVLRGDGMK